MPWLSELFSGRSQIALGADEANSLAAMQIRAFSIGCLLASLLVVLIASMATAGSGAGIVFVLGIAFTAIGYVIGLLFSVPRALASASESADSSKSQSQASLSTRMYSINTNLEQVSDWLTKIIVGVGLVEAHSIVLFIGRSAHSLGIGLSSQQPSLKADAADLLGLGIIVAYPALGFLLGFFSVRMYISRAFYVADATILRPVEMQERVSALLGAAAVSQSPQAEAVDPAAALREAASQVQRAVTPRSLSRFSSGRVLWVDDNPSSNTYLINAFRELGIVVDTSLSTDDALARINSGPGYDAIITDMGRPPDAKAGYTLLEALKQRGVKTPVLIFAGSDSDEHRHMARAAGAVDSTNKAQRVFEFVTQVIEHKK